jgi:dethiobiotin synthase
VDGIPGEMTLEAQRAYKRLNELVGPPPITDNAKTSPEMLEPKDTPLLMRFSGCEAALGIVNPYRYQIDVVPWVAATMGEQSIDLGLLGAALEQLAAQHDVVVVEGNGGLAEPLTRAERELDFVRQSKLPVVFVGTTEQRMANHVLLAMQHLAEHDVSVAGVILRRAGGQMEPKEAVVAQVIDAVFGDVVRGVLPVFDDEQLQTPALLAHRFEVHLDIDAMLASG